MNLFKCILFLVFIQVTISSISSIEKRKAFYNKYENFLDKRLKIVESNSELSVFMVEQSEKQNPLLRIPKNLTVCSFDLFPFKFEIYEYLIEYFQINKEKGEIKKKANDYLLYYALLFNIYKNKSKVEDYIKKEKIEKYYNLTQNEDLFDSFPELHINLLSYDKSHFDEMGKSGEELQKEQLQYKKVFDFVYEKIENSQNLEIMIPWISDFKKFRWVVANVKSRAFSFMFSYYNKLFTDENIRNSKNFIENEKFNSQFEMGSCIVSFIDLLNHHQEKNTEDIRAFSLHVEKGYVTYSSSFIFEKGQEVTYSYRLDPSNHILAYNYGFVFKENIYTMIKSSSINKNFNLNKEQIEICENIRCFGDSLILRTDKPNEDYLKYSKVFQLPQNYEKAKIIKLLKSDSILSINHKICSWLDYRLRIIESLSYFPNYNPERIQEAQIFRNRSNKYKSFGNSRKIFKKWKFNQIHENIAIARFSNELIFLRNFRFSLDKVIETANLDLNKIKLKYLS